MFCNAVLLGSEQTDDHISLSLSPDDAHLLQVQDSPGQLHLVHVPSEQVHQGRLLLLRSRKMPVLYTLQRLHTLNLPSLTESSTAVPHKNKYERLCFPQGWI